MRLPRVRVVHGVGGPRAMRWLSRLVSGRHGYGSICTRGKGGRTMKRFLVTMVFALLLLMPRAGRAQLFQIISPPPPKVFGMSAVKLSVPPTVWWTRLCVDVPE